MADTQAQGNVISSSKSNGQLAIAASLGKFTGNTKFGGIVYTLEGRLGVGSPRTLRSSTKASAVPTSSMQ